MYRIGYPFWRQAARLGVPLKLRVDVMHDNEANVFVATSEDLTGLVCEATSMDELVKETNAAICELLTIQLHQTVTQRPVTDLRLAVA